MTICCHVATMFHDRYWNTIYKLTNEKRNINTEVPDAIVQDPIFHQLLAEGSLEVIITVGQSNRLEKDPLAGIDATGKRIPGYNAGNPADSSSSSVFAVSAPGESTGSAKACGKKSSGAKAKKAESAKADPAKADAGVNSTETTAAGPAASAIENSTAAAPAASAPVEASDAALSNAPEVSAAE